MLNEEDRKIAAALKRLEAKQLIQSFDPFRPESRPNKKQAEILADIGKIQYRYVIAGNQSGKSQLACRELSWVATETHPFWKRPAHWGHEPLLLIVAGQDKRNIENELWGKKIKPFLNPSDWKETRQGGVLQYAENVKSGNKILFLSHSDGSDNARKHLQGYVAHYVLLDEMPGSKSILEELQRRVDSRKGYFLATFTPKTRNDEIRKIVDSVREPLGKKYRMSKLDNPLFADSLADEVEKLNGYSESEKRTILYGDWSTGDSAVYQFNYDTMTVPGLPETYSRGWRHVASLDPASKNAFGYTLWAEDASTGVWYLVNDQYIEGVYDPNALLDEVTKRNQGYNIVRQVCDPHEAWFIALSNARQISYHVPYDKNNRKTDLIKGLQHALSAGQIKIGQWCTTFIDEVQSCQWSETTDRIINATKYHTMDCAQYFVDCKPKSDPVQITRPWEVELRQGNEQRKKANAVAQKLQVRNNQVRVGKPIFSWGNARG
jgi:hypothetical protein